MDNLQKRHEFCLYRCFVRTKVSIWMRQQTKPALKFQMFSAPQSFGFGRNSHLKRFRVQGRKAAVGQSVMVKVLGLGAGAQNAGRLGADLNMC